MLLQLETARKQSKYFKDKIENLCVRYNTNELSEEVASMLSVCKAYAANIMRKELQLTKKVA